MAYMHAIHSVRFNFKKKTNALSNAINISHFELFGRVLCLLGGKDGNRISWLQTRFIPVLLLLDTL